MKPARIQTILLIAFIFLLAWKANCQDKLLYTFMNVSTYMPARVIEPVHTEVTVQDWRKTYTGWSYFPDGYDPSGWLVGLYAGACAVWLDENYDLWFHFNPHRLEASYIYTGAFEWVQVDRAEEVIRLKGLEWIFDLWEPPVYGRVPAGCINLIWRVL